MGGGRISFGNTLVSGFGFDSRLTVTQDDFVNSKDHKSDYKEHKVEDNLTSYFSLGWWKRASLQVLTGCEICKVPRSFAYSGIFMGSETAAFHLGSADS